MCHPVMINDNDNEIFYLSHSPSGDGSGWLHVHRQDPRAAQLLPGVPRRRHHQRVDRPHLHQHAAGAHHHQRRLGPQDANPGKQNNITEMQRAGRNFAQPRTKIKSHLCTFPPSSTITESPEKIYKFC